MIESHLENLTKRTLLTEKVLPIIKTIELINKEYSTLELIDNNKFYTYFIMNGLDNINETILYLIISFDIKTLTNNVIEAFKKDCDNKEIKKTKNCFVPSQILSSNRKEINLVFQSIVDYRVLLHMTNKKLLLNDVLINALLLEHNIIKLSRGY